MATILAFPRVVSTLPPPTEGMTCPPLGVRFPRLLRRVEPPADPHQPLYAMDDSSGEGAMPGPSWRVVAGVDPEDGFSLILRLHEDEIVAFGYLSAVADAGSQPLAEPLITPRGTFTLITRPTAPDWPAPLLIHAASWASPSNWTGIGFWSAAVDPWGRLLDPSEWCDEEIF